MKMTRTILCLLAVLALLQGLLFAVSADETADAGLGDIMAGILADTEGRSYEIKAGDTVYANASVGYGEIETDEMEFANYETEIFFHTSQGNIYWFISSSPDSGDYFWKCSSGSDSDGYVFLKLDIQTDAYLALSHEAIENSWTNMDGFDFYIEVIRIRDGETTVLSSVYSEHNSSFEANSLLQDAGNVKAGDTVYIALRGNWDAKTHFVPSVSFRQPDPEQAEPPEDTPTTAPTEPAAEPTVPPTQTPTEPPAEPDPVPPTPVGGADLTWLAVTIAGVCLAISITMIVLALLRKKKAAAQPE